MALSDSAPRSRTGLAGTILLATVAAPLLAAAGVYVLIRERRRRHARARHSALLHRQRLLLMGETASMLAHELNQPLAAATNYVSLLNRSLSNGADMARGEMLKDASHKAGEQIERAINIVQRLRNFIGKRDSERAAHSPAMLVTDAVALFETFDTGLRLQTHIESELPDLLVDRVEIQQVIVNLLRNAIEAMAGSARRELQLKVVAAPQGMVAFRLRDSGAGLSKDVAERLFRPFVSTKADGMGVGLSICHKIVRDHGGRIWAEPAVGGGTVFCFTLPGIAEQAHARAA